MKANSSLFVSARPGRVMQRVFLALASLLLLCGVPVLWRQAATAAPFLQAVAPPPTSQRVKYLGQTGGIITDFAIHDDLVFVPEGDALTILRQGVDRNSAAVLARTSPNQGRIQGLAVTRDTVFAITPIGLAAIDVRDPSNPQLQSFLPGGGEAIQVAGNFAFVAARAAGLRVINVADPRRPVLASLLPLPGKAVALVLDTDANLAYVATDTGGLRVIDITMPDLPREVASMEPPAGVQQLELQRDLLSLSSGDRILLMDVSQPGVLVRLGEYAPPRHAHRVQINGDYTYVGDLDGGLKVFDVRDMARPLLVYAEIEGTIHDLLALGNRLYVADGVGSLRILDVSRPTEPRLISQLPLTGVAQGLELWGDYILVALGEDGLAVVSIANERAPVMVGALDTAGEARDVKADENFAYLADGPEGLAIISLAQPTSPQLRGTLYTPGEAQALDMSGTFVYVAADDGGLQIINAIRPAAPFLVGTLSLPDGQRAVDIALVGKRAYLAIQGATKEDTGLAIADVGFRDRPVILSRVPGPGQGVAVRGVEPLAVGGRELKTVDARASSGPVLLGHYQPPLGAGGIDQSDSVLYLTSGGVGPELTLLDVTDPGHPRESLNLGRTSGGGMVSAAGGTVYLASGRRGLRALSLSGEGLQSERAIYDPMDALMGLTTATDYPYQILGFGEAGWTITDIKNPLLPIPLAHVQTDAPVHGLVRVADAFYAPTTARGLLIFDATAPDQSMFIGQWAGSTSLRDILVYKGYLYLADWQGKLHVLDPLPVQQPARLQTIPVAGTPERIVLLGDGLAYVLSGRAGLRLVDLGHPTAGMVPTCALRTKVNTIRLTCPPGAKECAEPYAYSLDGDMFSVWDLSQFGCDSGDGWGSGDLEEAAAVARFRINGAVLLLAGDRALVGSDAGHVSIVDLQDPSSPRVVGMMGNGAAVKGMALRGDTLIVGLEASATNDNPDQPSVVGQLRVWDIQDPRDPSSQNVFETPAPFSVVVKSQNERWLVTAGDSLTLYDLVGLPAISLGADVPLPAPARSLFLDDDLAYVGTDSALVVVKGLAQAGADLSILAELHIGSPVTGVAVAGDRGYVALGGAGPEAAAMLIDLSNPAIPTRMANLPAPAAGAARDLALVGDQLWIASEGWVSGLDISRPLAGPVEIGSFAPEGVVPTDLAVIGDWAYLTDADSGLMVLNISDPSAPILLDTLDTPGQAHAVAVNADGRLGYIADGECGVRVVSLNASGTSAPTEVGYWQTGFALDVETQGGQVYVADIGELMALESDLTGEPTLPPTPRMPQPADDAMFYQADTTLHWGPPASQCDPLTYDLYLGSQSPPPLVATDLVSPTFQVTYLERRQTYFWRVVVRDRQGDEVTGPLWQFHMRTPAQRPAAPTPAPRPQLSAPAQNQVMPLIGGLAAAGLVLAALWWFLEQRRT